MAYIHTYLRFCMFDGIWIGILQIVVTYNAIDVSDRFESKIKLHIMSYVKSHTYASGVKRHGGGCSVFYIISIHITFLSDHFGGMGGGWGGEVQ